MDAYFLNLQTEDTNQASKNIDERSTEEILRCINEEDQKVPQIVGERIPEITQAVDVIWERMQRGGRLFYFGAGTSGRLGVLDASECVPTYGVSPQLVQAYIAGGDAALRTPAEGCEDDEKLGESNVSEHDVSERDVVVGISASGSAKYVVGVLKKAEELGAYTIAVVNNKNSLLKEAAKLCIELETGAEVVSGSTRMKAGTSQKLVLNMLTTATMIRLGKVYDNLMVDLKASNRKLEERAQRIFCNITKQSEEMAKYYLKAADMDTKLAVMMCMSGRDRQEAQSLLDKNAGFLKKALREAKREVSA
ncbi:MAG: N-acetylmuramic acid 6-phosphate etherase [bacterium]|nr:N-acetylmuramic acid 6-phosphate etherase [bacterium]